MTEACVIIACPRRLLTEDDATDLAMHVKLHEPREGAIVLDGSPMEPGSWDEVALRRLLALLIDVMRRRGVVLEQWPAGAAAEMRRLWTLVGHLILEQAYRLNESTAPKEADVAGRLPPRSKRKPRTGGA